MSYKILAINPGSTSTKIAVFSDKTCLFEDNIAHEAETLKAFKEISDQFDYRRELIERSIAKAGYDLSEMDAFVGRGGGLVSMTGGTYTVNDIMYKHAKECFAAKHPAALGPQLTRYFATLYGKKAFVVNPPDVDEFIDFARQHVELTFLVTEIGCGIAGYSPEQIAPHFINHSSNVLLPKTFEKIVRS